MQGYLRPLAHFAQIVEDGSITGAARTLGLSPSALSESVRTLEARLGTPLLQRGRRGVTPTGKGLEVYEEARQIAAALRRVMAPEQGGTLEGTVKVSLPAEVAEYWIADGLHDLARTAPGIRVQLLVDDTLRDATKYARDLYVRVGPSAERAGVTMLAKARQDAVLVCAAGLDMGKAPNGLTLICAPFKGKTAEVRLGRGRMTFDETLIVDAAATRVALARAGLGATACLRRTVADDLASGAMIQIAPETLTLPVWSTVQTPHARPTAAQKAVAEAIAATF